MTRTETTKIPEFKPQDLDRFPEVDALLRRLDLGEFTRDSLTAPVGRNDVWAGVTTRDRAVFVKRLVGPESNVAARMRRLLAYEKFSRGLSPDALCGPPILGSDDEHGLIVSEYLGDAKSGAELVVDESFDNELCARIGRGIGILHATVPDDSVEIDRSLPPQPSASLLRGLPTELFESLSFAELESWRLMQRDQQLVEAVTWLRERERDAVKVPSHCDLRMDQFLVTDHDVHVTDWEEFRLADPARDVGAFAGEWLHRSVLDIVTTRGDTAFADLELTHETVLKRGVEKMERLLPRVHHFWNGYRETRPPADPGFAERATAFAGWHLLDRLLAGAARSARLSGIERAAAGIGRSALLTPEKFAHTLGFEEAA